MKRILLAFILGATSLVGSAQSQHCRIEGRAPESENGKTDYLNAYGVSGSLDSAVVRDGKFEFTREDSGIRRLNLGRKYSTTLIVEPGTVRVDLSNPKAVGGTPLNDSIAAMNRREAELFEEYGRIQKDSTLTPLEKQEKGAMVANCF